MLKDFSTPLSIMDRTDRQKSNKEMEDLKNTIDHLDLTDYLQNTPTKSSR